MDGSIVCNRPRSELTSSRPHGKWTIPRGNGRITVGCAVDGSSVSTAGGGASESTADTGFDRYAAINHHKSNGRPYPASAAIFILIRCTVTTPQSNAHAQLTHIRQPPHAVIPALGPGLEFGT